MKAIGKYLAIAAICLSSSLASAGERKFTYVYDTELLPEDTFEFEQWVTNENGRDDGDYSRWRFRSELEYGISETLQTAVYLNLESKRTDEETESDFKGFSSEWIYQLLNPITDPVGLALYAEYTTDTIDQEFETKILLSKDIDKWSFAFNAIYEMESEKDGSEREKEAKAEFTAGVARRIAAGWTAGIEARQKSAYPDGYDLSGQEYQAVSVGPVVHYGGKKVWGTLTVLPQVWGNGDGASGGRQLAHEEEIEVRLIVGTFF